MLSWNDFVQCYMQKLGFFAGQPLGNEDILKAVLLQHIPGRERKRTRQHLMKEWTQVALKLHKRQNINSNSNSTKAWHHRNGVMLTVALRGAIELPASLVDELLEHMRRLNDPDRYGIMSPQTCVAILHSVLHEVEHLEIS